VGYRDLSLRTARPQPNGMTSSRGVSWLRGDALLTEFVLVILVSLLSLAVLLYSNGSSRLEPGWLLLAPAAGMVFGALPAWAIRRSSYRLQSLALDRRQLVSLLLKDYAGGRGDWLWKTNAEGELRGVSEKFALHIGRNHRDLEGQPFEDVLRGNTRRDSVHLAELLIAIRQRKPFFDLAIKVDVKGEVQWWRLAGMPTFRAGRFAGYIGTASDVTAELKARESVNQLAFKDGLTGLSNRSHFDKRLEEACTRLKRYGTPFAVFYLDLDRFKAVNDTHGHRTGDQLLIEVGQRLGAQLRENDTFARLGGDEFAVILPDCPGVAGISTVASRLIAEIEKPYLIGGDALVIGLSVGVARAPADGRRADEILHNADVALYRAKGEGGNRYCLYDNAMDLQIRQREAKEREIAQGLKKHEFTLDYTAVVEASSESTIGLAASIRWRKSAENFVEQSEFMPVAERSTLICALGDQAITQACDRLRSLPESLRIAVAISTKHFLTTDICGTIGDALRRSQVDPGRLEIEVNGSLLLANNPDVAGKLEQLNEMGVGLTLGDFGTGLSGMAHLLAFPGRRIKLDRAFVERHLESGDEHGVLDATIVLAHCASTLPQASAHVGRKSGDKDRAAA
jgi:diguanylate cyclase (GGDEF)-like protein/PAS domain S-box-containing protein